MKLFSLIIRTTLIVLLISFTTNLFAQPKKAKKPVVETIIDSPFISFKTKKNIQDTLFKSYYKKCKRQIKMYDDAAKVVVDTVEGSIQIRYVNYNNEPSFAPMHQIPAINNFIEGDLNHDNLNDLIVSVYYNQNSRPRLNIYCYITNNKKLRLYKIYTIHELGICGNGADTSGRFFPERIENGELIGRTECLQAGDPGCCPSLEMDTYFKFEKGLKFVKQAKKK